MAAKDPGVNHPVPRARVITVTLTTADTMNPVDISDLEGITVQVTSAGAGTAQFDISNDGTNFVGLTAALAVGTPAAMPVGMAFLALGLAPKWIRVSAVAVATVTIIITGQKRQSNV